MENPVLYLVFNREEETRRSFEAIKSAKPKKLYIAADGPRVHIKNEVEKCEQVRKIASNVDWHCEVKTLFRKENLGCKNAVVGAINWFFENEEKGIIIEDDVIPNSSFFSFCDIMLERYQNKQNIIAICGFNQFGQEIESNEYFYSRGFYPWGWATWRKRWENYDKKDFELSKLDSNKVLEIYDKAAIAGVRFNLNLIKEGILDTWDYQMVFMIMSMTGFVVTPFANLTSNIGINGAHSINNKKIFFKYGKLNIEEIQHPQEIMDNAEMNARLWEEYRNAYLIVRFKQFLLKAKIYLYIRKIYKYYKKIAN